MNLRDSDKARRLKKWQTFIAEQYITKIENNLRESNEFKLRENNTKYFRIKDMWNVSFGLSAITAPTTVRCYHVLQNY